MFDFNATYRTTHSKLPILFRKIQEQFIGILDSTCIRSYDSVHEIAEVALALLGSAHCTTLQDASLQDKLLEVGMSTFIHSSALPTSFKPSAINAVLQRPYNTGNLETFYNSIVESFLGTNLSGCTDSLKTKLLRILDAIEPPLLRTNILSGMYLHCIMQNICSIEIQCDKLMLLDLSVSDTSIFASEMLKTVLCLSSNDCIYIMRKRTVVGLEYHVVCTVCDKDSTANSSNQPSGVIMFKLNRTRSSLKNIIHKYRTLFYSDNEEVRMNMVNCLPSIANHFSKDLAMLATRNDWPKFFTDASIEIRSRFANTLHELLASVQSKESQNAIVNKCLENLRTSVISAVSVENQPVQASVVMLLLKFSTHSGIKEDVLLRCFKMQLIFLLRVESEVAKNAMLAVTEMCIRFGTNPKQLFDWYKDIVFSLLIDAAVANFMEHGLGLNTTFANVSF